MDNVKQTYSYQCGEDNKYRITHRADGEFVASIGADSSVPELEAALKSWILSPDLRKTVEGWLSAQLKPKAVKVAKAKGTRGGKVTTKKIAEPAAE